MKKFLPLILCFSAFFLFSCASKPPVQSELSPEINAPSTDEEKTAPAADENNSDLNNLETSTDISTISSNEENEDLHEDLESEKENDEVQTEIIDESDIDIPNADITPAINNEENELEEIEEPQIITLEPLPEDNSKNLQIQNDNQNEEIVPDEQILHQENNAQTDNPDTADNEANSDNTDNQTDDIILIDEQQNYDDSTIIESDNDVIDITNDELPDSLEEEITNDTDNPEKQIIPSRKVTLKRQEYLDISYPGSGWIYMGITDDSKDLAYYGRKLGTQDTNFSLQAKNEGTKILHFTKNDPLTDTYIDDYIEVEILSEKGSNKTHITAPEYKMQPSQKSQQIIEKSKNIDNNSNLNEKNDESVNISKSNKEEKSSEFNKSNNNYSNTNQKQSAPAAQTVAQLENLKDNKIESAKADESSVTVEQNIKKSQAEEEIIDPKVLLQEAKVLYNEKEYKLSLEKINAFLEISQNNIDEALFLQGQCYEAKSEIQDIKAAINSYSTLTKNYPASKNWDKANKRIIYLKRFYLEAR